MCLFFYPSISALTAELLDLSDSKFGIGINLDAIPNKIDGECHRLKVKMAMQVEKSFGVCDGIPCVNPLL